MNENVSVIIPAYNEVQNIPAIVSKIKHLHLAFQIIVLNDGFNDDTATVAGKAGATVYSPPQNIGNGAAVRTGIRMAKGDFLAFLDADGQHKPEDIQAMLDHLPRYDMVVVAKNMEGQASVGRAIGNTFYNWLASYVAKYKITDLTSGFRAVKADIAKSFLHLFPNNYSYTTTITLGVLRSAKQVQRQMRY